MFFITLHNLYCLIKQLFSQLFIFHYFILINIDTEQLDFSDEFSTFIRWFGDVDINNYLISNDIYGQHLNSHTFIYQIVNNLPEDLVKRKIIQLDKSQGDSDLSGEDLQTLRSSLLKLINLHYRRYKRNHKRKLTTNSFHISYSWNSIS